MSNIYVHSTDYGRIWMRCNDCGSSSVTAPAKFGVSLARLVAWADSHFCVDLQEQPVKTVLP